MLIAQEFLSMIPENEIPERTSDYEGFYHLTDMTGDVENTIMEFIIRDFSQDKFRERKETMRKMIDKINAKHGARTAELEIKDQYYNMHDIIDKTIYVIDLAKEAISNTGITPQIVPIRGGTDGARLSYMGLPCPNIFAGGHNFHGKYEYVPVQSMEKASQVIVEIARLVAEKELKTE
jgi:tripeptide aminopeptidase